MAARKKAAPKGSTSRMLGALVLLIALLVAWAMGGGEESAPTSQGPVVSEQAMVVRFIDVGQGASTLVSMGDTHVLIDAGENDQGQKVVNQLKAWGVTHLTMAIGTHPHSDHIGGMDNVLRDLQVDEYLMPDAVHTSKTFESVIDVLEEKKIPVTFPKAGDVFNLGGMRLTILGPIALDEGDLNNCSLVSRIESAYGTVLIPGDAEASSEADILKSGRNVKADVLQMGHHGSSTSSSEAFLRAVNPKWVVIPCGEGNSYGHPHRETLASIEKLGYQAYRTDWHGTVTCVMDEKGITFTTEK